MKQTDLQIYLQVKVKQLVEVAKKFSLRIARPYSKTLGARHSQKSNLIWPNL